MTETKVGSIEDFPEGQGRVVEVGGTRVAVFNVDGELHALDNACRHKGGPLGEGRLDGETVTCPWHGWRYDVTSGENVEDATVEVESYGVEVRDGEVYVRG